MTPFARVWPFVWPFRRQLFLSVVFAVFVALLWGMNLSIAFPVVKVLLQGQSLHSYVDAQVAAAERERSELLQRLLMPELQKVIQETADDSAPSAGLANPPDDLLTEKAKLESRLTAASRELLGLRWLQSHILPYIPHDQFDTFALILAALLFATLLKGVCIFAQDAMVGNVVQLATMGIRTACFRRTLKLDYQTLAGVGTADLMSRFTFDVDTLANGLLLLGGRAIREPLKALSCIVLAFWINWRLTLLSLVFVPLALLVFHRFGQMLKRASHRSMESMSRMYKVLEETFDAVKVVIAFDGGQRHRQRFHAENKTYYEKSMSIVVIDSLTNPTTEILGIFAVLVAMLPGAYLVLRGTKSIWGINLATGPMDIAELSVLYALLAGVSDPVRKLSSVYARLKRSAAAADRIFHMMDLQTEVNQDPAAIDLPRHSRSIEFRKVEFAYARHEAHARPAVLDDVTLKIAAGEVIAVVGENGSGKSTLVNLLPRFYDPDHGSVQVDGIDIRDCRIRSLRSQVGVVTQETLLFDESIYENIRYSKPEATRDEVMQAAEQAHVLQFVEQLPEGFETRVGEKGSRLSGGQRQRIALARAILRDPAILILDEATSAIDSQSEFLIHKALAEFVRGRTTFIITHSVTNSILELVSRIVVMDQGRLCAVGTHAELLDSCPVYRSLYRVQGHQLSA